MIKLRLNRGTRQLLKAYLIAFDKRPPRVKIYQLPSTIVIDDIKFMKELYK